MSKKIILKPINIEQAGIRLDKFLTTNLPDFSRERIKYLIINGHIILQGTEKSLRPSQKVNTGDIFELNTPPLATMNVEPQNIPLEVLYEDSYLIIINKPAGISVHPAGPQVTDTLVNALLYHCDNLSGIGGVERPGIVHRLDKGTSGVMVVAKSDKTHQALSELFAKRDINRLYIAMCYGTPSPTRGEIETLIGRHVKNRKKMAVVEKNGKIAKTTYQMLENFNFEASLIQLKLFSGRTHQIRVHMHHLGYPIIGDPLYQCKKKLKNVSEKVNNLINNLNHQMLHAKMLGFNHPITGEYLEFTSSPPKDFTNLWQELQYK